MQEGAGVRQIVEDELRALGIRLRDLDVRLELGLQESVRSAVQAGYGVTFISRSAVESELAAGTLAAARVEGLDAKREISLVRASGRTRDARRRRVRRVRARQAGRVIVRWGLERAARRSPGERPFVVASPRWRDVLDAPDAGTEVPSHRIEVPPTASTTIVAVGGGSAIDTGKAASAASGLPLVSVPTTYSGAEWTEFFGVRDPDRQDARRRRGREPARDRLRAEADARAAARRDRRHGAERARALRRGALRRGAQRRGRCRGARRRAADRRRGCRRWSSGRTTSRRERSSSAAPVTPERRSASRSSRSATRWRRRSAAATALPHGAMNALTACRRRSASTEPVAADAVARFGAGARHRRSRPRGWRSSRGSAASSACATSAIPEEAPARSPRRSPPARRARRTRARSPPADVGELLRSIW